MSDNLLGRLFSGGLFARLSGGRLGSGPVGDLYTAVVTRAREPVFYRDLGVPDTLDGRFDLVALHCFLVMRRLKGRGAEAGALSRRLYETMIDNFEKSLLEMGVGDSGIGRRVKTMARALAGRIRAYDEALAEPDDRRLEVALDNNVYGTVVEGVDPAALAALTVYVRASADALDAQPLEALLRGEVAFAALPEVRRG
ncbi:ubiquinol-cytochrome C chaperone family protein [Azospirillum agricola]|uniref:ubiquinol-cytochrome C chaperone family protein n=1 Tax=Azospirillum agricola TaxID=1720247 RepID=UPI000A0F1501|nr:ubiquinol-cytochrome C chaperone family protein [Azospirillum agricola]SMH52485.1 cytochrome b pre-mRNA-processing protein 3 [Azospirillum lipoferum]